MGHERVMGNRWVTGLLWAFGVAWPVAADEPNGPFAEIKTAPVSVAWEYSNDGGKTYAKTAFAPPPPGTAPKPDAPVYPYAWKGVFSVDDPAQVGGLWIRMTGGGEDPRSSICNGDLVAASGGYWKDLGFCPTLLDAVITLNGKEVPIAHGPILQFWVPLTGEVKKGANTVEMRGNVYTYWGGAAYAGLPPAVAALDAKVVAAAPQPAAIYNGPVLGDFGDGYFTLACRTQLAADLTVEATPIEPAAPVVTVTSAGKVWHRVKVEVPAGTRRLSYRLTAKVGSHETKRGPFSVTLPGKEYRFVAFGNAMQHPANDDLSKEPWAVNSRLIATAKPAFAVNTGNLMEHETWSFRLEKSFVGPASELLAGVPMLVTPCNRDFAGVFNELHWTPAADGWGHNWSKVIGPVRFIGIDGNDEWEPDGANAKWLDAQLAAAKEKFVVVLSGYPGYSSGINSKKLFGGRASVRSVVMPLLGKHKATLMLCGWDPTYERIEPTPDKGVTQIITGCIGRGSWHRWDSRMGSHEFGPPQGNARGTTGKVPLPDGREWVGYFSTRHFVVFDVTADAIRMKALAADAAADAGIDGLRILDEKTFKPRQ